MNTLYCGKVSSVNPWQPSFTLENHNSRLHFRSLFNFCFKFPLRLFWSTGTGEGLGGVDWLGVLRTEIWFTREEKNEDMDFIFGVIAITAKAF